VKLLQILEDIFNVQPEERFKKVQEQFIKAYVDVIEANPKMPEKLEEKISEEFVNLYENATDLDDVESPYDYAYQHLLARMGYI